MAAHQRKTAVTQTAQPANSPARELGMRLAARLVGETAQGDAGAYRDLSQRLATLRAPCFWPALPGKPPLTGLERAGLVRLVEAIAGPCGEEKMLAVIEAMRHAPAGDVVEIGSSWGRTAALLTWLARRYDVGQVLCVDSWAADQAADPDEALRIFEINLAPLAEGRLNYIRARADQAAKLYAAGLDVRTEAFGETHYAGRIAFLHLGGAEADTAWTPHVAPGGWICFAGYDRAPDVADAYLERNQARVSTRFQAGASLFVQLKR